MDRESLRLQASSRRNERDARSTDKVVWSCQHCMRDFQTENGFMNHRCAEREKLDVLQSPRGMAAYSYYGEWMRVQKRSVPAADRFMNSRQFNYFLNFVDWSNKTAVPNTDQFIKLMVETATPPLLWCRDATFSMYLQWYDNAFPPSEQFIQTFDLLQSKARDLEVPVSEVYEALGARELAKMVRRRKLSPWLLVLSQNFLKWIQTLPSGERDMLSDAINFSAYIKKLKNSPELAQEFRSICEIENV